MEFLNKTKESVKETNREVISHSLGFITSAFIFVAGLAWNEAIKELINRYLNDNSSLISRFVYAIIVTVIAVVVSLRLNKFSKKINIKNEELI